MTKYLKIEEVKPGDVVELDGGFTCVHAGQTVLQADERGSLFFPCAEGEHHIDGQLNEAGELVGISRPA